MHPNHKKNKGLVKPDGTKEFTSLESIMPDVETLEKLEKICPGSAQEWMTLAKSEISHRQEIEKKLVKSYNFNTIYSPIFGITATVLILITGVIFLNAGHPTVGGSIIISSLATTVAQFVAFIYKRSNNKNDNKN